MECRGGFFSRRFILSEKINRLGSLEGNPMRECEQRDAKGVRRQLDQFEPVRLLKYQKKSPSEWGIVLFHQATLAVAAIGGSGQP